MLTLEKIKEIKTKLAHLKASLRQALTDSMFIDEIDLMDIEEMTLEQVDDIRKRVARLRMSAGEKINSFLRCWEQF